MARAILRAMFVHMGFVVNLTNFCVGNVGCIDCINCIDDTDGTNEEYFDYIDCIGYIANVDNIGCIGCTILMIIASNHMLFASWRKSKDTNRK